VRRRIVILTRATTKTVIERRYGTVGQARFAMAASVKGITDFKRAETEDTAQSRAVGFLRRAIPDDIKTVEIDREIVAQFLFEPHDLVVAVGQDGLVANVGKYLDGQPLAGVNPDPENIDGALLPFRVETFAQILPMAIADRQPLREATLAEATTSDGQVLRGLNEIFVGVPTHQSARYRIRHARIDELQSSSGLIVATGTGSTGWLRSLQGDNAVFDPAADELRFVVREAWPGKGFAAKLVEGQATRQTPLMIESRMDAGVIFADGIEADPIRFDAGMTVTIAPSARRVRLLQDSHAR
jgi:NAD kinase